jgi:hypothetical protein
MIGSLSAINWSTAHSQEIEYLQPKEVSVLSVGFTYNIYRYLLLVAIVFLLFGYIYGD